MVETIPAEVKSTNFIFKLDTKISNFTQGCTYLLTFDIFGGDMAEI